jgi:thiol:disulfide interchange protein DsbD
MLSVLLASVATAGAQDNVSVIGLPLTPVVPGEHLEVAVVFSMQDDWHIYWTNPGDAGMSPYFDWRLPAGVTLLDRKTPVPERYRESGITTFVHNDIAVYLFTFSTSEALPEDITLGLSIEWLECREVCLPGRDSLDIQLTAEEPAPEVQEMRKRAMLQYPRRETDIQASVRLQGDQLVMTMPSNDYSQVVDFFPLEEFIYDLNADIRVRTGLRKMVTRIPLWSERADNPAELRGILVTRHVTPDSNYKTYDLIELPVE